MSNQLRTHQAVASTVPILWSQICFETSFSAQSQETHFLLTRQCSPCCFPRVMVHPLSLLFRPFFFFSFLAQHSWRLKISNSGQAVSQSTLSPTQNKWGFCIRKLVYDAECCINAVPRLCQMDWIASSLKALLTKCEHWYANQEW